MEQLNENNYVCKEHSGMKVNIANIITKVEQQSAKIDQIYARINVILGSVCCSLILIIVDLILRINKLK